jgi:hypothetical protein
MGYPTTADVSMLRMNRTGPNGDNTDGDGAHDGDEAERGADPLNGLDSPVGTESIGFDTLFAPSPGIPVR